MKIAYHAENTLDAHLVLSVLLDHGLEARVSGDVLTAGIGELPMGGLVKVWVEDADALRAAELIERWRRGEFGLDDAEDGVVAV